MKMLRNMMIVALVCSGASAMAMSEEDKRVQELTHQIEQDEQTLASLGYGGEGSWSKNIIKKAIEERTPELKKQLKQAIQQAIAVKETRIQSLGYGGEESWSKNIIKEQMQKDIAGLQKQLAELE